MAAPAAGFAPAVQNRHSLDAVGGGATGILVQLAELVANALHVVDEFRELQRQFQIAAVADAVHRLAQDSPPRSDPVFLGFLHRVAALVEGIGEEVGQETALGVFHAGDVADEPQGAAVAHAAHHRVQPDGGELRHVGLGADPVVAQEHHGFLAQLVGDVHHLLGQLCHLAPLEGHEVLELLAGHTVLVVVVALVDDEFRAELVAHFLLELLQDVGADRGGIAVPVHILLPLELVEHQGELVEEGGVADDVHVGMVGDELAQAFHGELVSFGLTYIEGDLMFKVLPVVGHRVVHMYGIPNDVSQKTHGVLVVGFRRGNDHAAICLVVAPGIGGQRLTSGTIHDLPPALHIIPGVYLQQLITDTLHERYAQLAVLGGVKAGHNVALLYLVRIRLRPSVVLAGGIVGGIDFRTHFSEFFGEFGAVAVPNCVRAPAFQNLDGLRYNVEVGGNGYSTGFQIVIH